MKQYFTKKHFEQMKMWKLSLLIWIVVVGSVLGGLTLVFKLVQAPDVFYYIIPIGIILACIMIPIETYWVYNVEREDKV